MAGFIYGLCAISATICAGLLLKSYQQARYRMLLWSSLCFAGLAINNLLLVVDKLILPNFDLSLLRSSIALAAMSTLLFGLIFDAE